jgi:hypothetical protein
MIALDLRRQHAALRDHQVLVLFVAEHDVAEERPQLEILRRPPARHDRVGSRFVAAAPQERVAINTRARRDAELLARDRELRIDLDAEAVERTVVRQGADDAIGADAAQVVVDDAGRRRKRIAL